MGENLELAVAPKTSFYQITNPYDVLVVALIKDYLKIFENIQKVALPDRLPARLAAYTFWSLLLLLLMLLLGAIALAVAVAFAFAVAVAVTDTFRMGGDHESYKAL